MKSEKRDTVVVNKFTGSWIIFIFWFIVFLPVAIIYYFVKKKPVRELVR